ncbi:hypothetical protein EC991_004613 [Linnemannia zychae]|nr:hypothetical protein EC991_004613 [Linnemannia zychae]
MSENTWTYFSTIAYSLPRLRTLNIFDIVGLGTPIIVKRSAIRFLNTCSPDLERLVLAWGIISFSEALSDVSYNGNVKDHSTHLALKFLSVRGNAESSLAPFILRCPMLKAVINPGFQATCSTTLLHRDSPLHLALQETTGIRFMELHVPLTNTDDHAIGDLISNISRSPDGVQQRWRTIAINGEIKEGTDEITRAIVDNCREGLVHLSIPKAWQLKSRDLHSILCSLTDLRVFSVIHIPKMDVSDVISSPWVCRWLTRLSVQITNIPRPDILVDRKGYIKLASERKADGSVEESRAIQRKVYRQLGALTCLEFLDLGTDAEYGSREQLVDDIYGTIYDPQFQMNCLEMSLASGLDLLSDLQNLRSLRLVGMEHRIGIPELQWMLSHFIRLERLSGVDPEVAYLPLYLRPTRKYQPEPGVQQWLSKHVATWVLLE